MDTTWSILPILVLDNFKCSLCYNVLHKPHSATVASSCMWRLTGPIFRNACLQCPCKGCMLYQTDCWGMWTCLRMNLYIVDYTKATSAMQALLLHLNPLRTSASYTSISYSMSNIMLTTNQLWTRPILPAKSYTHDVIFKTFSLFAKCQFLALRSCQKLQDVMILVWNAAHCVSIQYISIIIIQNMPLPLSSPCYISWWEHPNKDGRLCSRLDLIW